MGIDSLLDAPPGADRIVTITTTALAQRNPSSEFPRYLAALKTSLRENPPPYGGQAYCDIFDEAARDGKWLAISLVTNAEREGDGATRLWTLSACASDAQEKALLKRHAVDESNHAMWYLAVFDLVFPGTHTRSLPEAIVLPVPPTSMPNGDVGVSQHDCTALG